MTSSSFGKFTSLSTLSLAGGAEISAFHSPAKLLFTIGGSNVLSVIDLSNPSKPVLLTSLTLAGVGNSVAVSSSGLVAVAVEGADAARYTEGKVAFFTALGVGSAATVTAAGTVAVGIVPDSIAFTPDGTKLVVANEGEPNELYTLDPVGSVSVISIDGTTPANSTVQSVDFTGLNGRDAELAALGIRVSGKAGNTVAQNLEPEYVAISADGKKAYVTFQENNAIGVIKLDGATPTLESLRSVGVQDYVRGQASIKSYDVTIASPGTTAAGGVVPGGGLSGLYATGKDADGRLTFLAPADRGPNGSGTTKDVVNADGTAGTDGTLDAVQPFLLPDYQARFYKLALNEATGVVSVTGEVKLTRKDGTTPITGRSNGKGDQIPVDATGNLLAYDTYGADLESIVQDKDGNIWMSDEYRPAIYKFDATGKLIERYVPVGAGVAAGLSAGALGAETLPAEYAKRQTNRGFEGMAYDAANGKLFAFVQSPLDDVGANDGAKGSLVRILEVSAATGAPTAEYLYAMAGKATAAATTETPFYESKVDKIGDVAYDAARQVFYVLERDSTAGALSYKQVFEMSLKGATNILGNAVANEENLSIDALKGQAIVVANKVLLTNLASKGYLPNDKPEGLALLADGRLAVINDNDFGVTGLSASDYNALGAADKAKYSLASDIAGSQTYVYAKGADAKTQLGIVSFTPTGIDPSDKDSKSALLFNQNIYGLRMPDGIAAFQAVGKDGSSQTFTVIANEGDTRVRPDGDYTANGSTTKDGTVFVDELRSGVTGTGTDNRLKIITDLGNYDSTTAAYEQKFAFGGRSISILDSLGNVIWDSGDAIDVAAIAAGTYDDGRSDDKGSEPENVTVAKIESKIYAFVALERSGGVVTFDITDPYNASLISYNKSATGVVSPEGLIIIPEDKSPNGRTLLVTSNEVSKQLEVLAQDYTLQLLHYYGESGLLGVKTAPIMGALIDKFDDQYANTLVIGEGDNFIPGPWLVGGADPSLNALAALGDASLTDTKSDGVTALGRPDIAIMNLYGTDVSALGNHEFDLGSPVLSSAIGASGNWKGAQFPLITSNLNFSLDSSLKGIADASLGGTSTNVYAGKEASEIKAKIAPYTVVTQGGEKIGIVGATTWDLLSKSSPNGTTVLDDANSATSDLQEVAAYVQASVDKLITAGVNKIIMIDQLDGLIERNKALAPLLKGVDVMVAGGGHERQGDSTDKAVPFNGHDANFIPEGYPLVVKDADGKDTLLVTTDTEYSYLGRLVVRFDSNGNVITSALDSVINGAYASTEASLQAAYASTKTSAEIIASSTIGKGVEEITNAIDKVIASKDGLVYGYTKVYLEGDRVFGRAQEVNLGNLSADANLYAASRILPAGTLLGSLKNGGGIRASVGSVDANGNKTKPDATNVKPSGAISQLEVENALRFDNKLMVFDTNPTGLLAILNYAAGLSSGNGGYAQIGGVRFSFDPSKEAGKKVQDVAIYDLGGTQLAKVVDNGVILATAPKTITLSTLNFMAQGGDGYPIKANGENFRYLLSNSNGSVSLSAAISEDLDYSAAATYAAYPNVLGEQDAFKSYLKAFHGTPDRAYNAADTIQVADQRIQNISVKPLDTVFADSNNPVLKAKVAGLKVSEVLTIGEAVGTYFPTGLPDGMGAYLKDANTIRLLFQSEITKDVGYAYKLANGTELTGARIHYLDIDKASNAVLASGLAYNKVIDRAGKEVTSANQISADGATTKNGFDRFCGANLIEANAFGTGKGFVDRIEFLGEESSSAYGGLGGSMVALDVANSTLYAMPDMGFGSWESATAVDTGNANQVALILGDDYASATVGAPIYMYVGTKSTAANSTFLQRNGLTGGKLYAWVATKGADLNRPSEFKGFGNSSTGTWVEIVTKDAAKAGTTGYDALGYKSATLLRADADSKNAFLAARIEDLDFNPNKPTQIAFNATGNEAFDGGSDLLGTVYTLDVSFNDTGVPAAGTLKIVYDGDDAGNGSTGLRSPDNLAFSKDGFIYAQEDKAVYSTASEPKYGTEKGSIWKLDPNTGKAIRWAQIDDSIDPDGAGGQALDTKDSGYLAYGWESSGIIDVSALYNHAPGTDFFANVQTHGVKGGAITDQNLVAGGQILKIENMATMPMFSSGVASGDPYADSVILWTRIDPKNTFSSSVAVNWEISTSKDFTSSTTIKKGTFTTNKDRDWTVKAEADGLMAGTQYYYRFLLGNSVSEIGSTKTLATNPNDVRLGVLSCANFTAESEFLVYGRAADINMANPFDAFVFVGDYIYEYGKGGYASAESAATARGFEPNKEITSLDDYRQRYAQYHTDVNLRDLRAGAPLIGIWDDHETANDSYAEGAENHQAATEGDWIARRDAALKAYYEWMPIREPLLRTGTDKGTAQTPLTKGYRSFDFGDVLSLHILETRLTARDKQLAYPDATAVQARLGAILQSPSSIAAYATKYGVAAPTSAADGTRFATALAPFVTNELVAAVVGEAYFGNRELMGKEQLDWLKNEMATSNASWQVLGQQVLMQNIAIPAELLLNAGDPKVLAKYAAPLQKLALGQTLTAEEQALFNEAGKIPYNLDAWDGYGAEREEIIKAALQLGKKLVSLAGDTHNAWAGVLDAASNADIAQQAFPSGNFMVGTENRAAFKEIITSGELTNNNYRFNGIPDGIGVIDNGSTLRVLVNHELASTAGVARAHGSTGAYVSDLTIDKATLAVVSGGDFLKSANDLYLANSAGTSWTNGTTYAFSRFCSADLAAAAAFKTATAGYDGRIFLTGEENGAEGKAFAHIVTGTEAGRVYELPSLGNFSFENVVANPKEQAKTIAVGLDDSTTDGQVYVYVGSKTTTGNAVEKAGLAGGKLFGIKVGAGSTLAQEVAATATETGLALTNGIGDFSLVDLGDVKAKTGAELNTDSKAKFVTNFLRPEDGAWSLDGKTFYFVTTATTTTNSRLWALEFSDASNPEAGGKIKVLLDGSEGHMSLDNITVANDGNILLQEDPGGNARLAKIWAYNVSTDKLTELAQHDPALFTGTVSGMGNITIDEEASGIVDITSFLTGVAGYDTSKFNYFLSSDQIHKTVSDPLEQVEMGQLSIMATSAAFKVTSKEAFPTGNFMVGTENRAAFKEIITSGEFTNNKYRFNGIPDGIGVIDNGSTLRVLVNHELANTAGGVRAHGSTGAYVSDLTIDKQTLAVISGGDFLKSANDLYLANSAGTSWTNGTTYAFSRFCSADLAAAAAFKTATAGYDGRIFLTGEENGAEGKAFAHIVTGTEAGRVYELPSLGNLSFENVVANPKEQAKTIAVGLDDSTTDGQVYVYVGSKTTTGNAVEKAGLAGGKLFGIKVGAGSTLAQEVAATATETGLALTNGIGDFSLVDLGDVKAKTGAELNTDSKAKFVTNFLRPEDGAWSLDGKTFYFVTTATTTTNSRLWSLEFSDASNPEAGGKIKVLLDGSEGHMSLDNITVANDGNILLQEDPGGNARLAKIWAYNVSTDKLNELAQHDPALFTGTVSGTGNITIDEEASGIVDITSFLTGVAGYDTSKFNYFLSSDQIHKTVSDPLEQVEMGQLSIMATPKVPITPGTVAGIELATPGVTSPGFEKYFPGVSGLDSLFEVYAKDLDYANLQNRGFLDVTFTKSTITAGFEYLIGKDPVTNQPNWERDTLVTNSSYKFKEYIGFDTPVLKAKVAGLKVSEVLTIGEAVGTYFPTGLPDGMGAYLKDANTIRLLFQSEITKDVGYAYKLANGTELTGARIHYLDIDKASNAVLASGLAYNKVIDRAGKEVTSANQISADGATTKNGFDRFCGANLIEANAFGTGKGFVDRIEFLGEESSSAYGGLGGSMVALDVANSTLYAMPDMGFGSWESATAVDTGNANQVALILGDDYASATVGAPIYMYVGTKSTAANSTFLQRNGLTGGKLYAWVATKGADLNRPSEFKGFGNSSTGTWVEIVTKDAAKAGTTGYDALGYKSATLLRADADSKNAFLAARIEDLDFNPNKPTQIAFNATGNEAFDGGSDLLGTVYTLDVSFNGTGVPAAGTLKIVYDGDDAGNGSTGLRSPDNLAFSKDGFIYAQEDKAVYSTASEPKYGTEKGSIWKLDPNTGKAIRWAQIDDSIDPDGAGGQALDTKDSGYLAYGWESSGIIDVSALYNHAPGTDFFANVQTHGVKGGAITDQNLVAGGQILKLEATVQKRDITYTSTSGQVMSARMTPTSGSIEGDVSFNRLAAAPSFTNQKPGLVIGQTGINFTMKLDQSSTSNTAKTSVDLAPLLDGLTTTNKRLAYFVYDTPEGGAAPVATAFTYDPIKKAGARFYDLDGKDGADTADLQFVDGGYGDKDGVKNGVVVDPSTPGVVSLTPIFTATSTALTVGDPTDSISPAALTVRATISAIGRAASVNQIGYVALNANEADTLTYELVRDRGTILLANLESSDTPNVSGMNSQRDINLINGQKLVFFEVVDTTLQSLLAKNTTLQGFGSSFRTLDLAKSTDTTATASKGGNTVALSLESAIAGLGELISSQMADTPIFDFTGLAGRTLEGTVSIAREANYNTSIGFYRIQRADGAVLDPITNTLITPGSAGYKAAALSSTNLFSGFGSLAVANGATRTDTIAAFIESGLLAPYATVVQTGDTFFSFGSANSDGLNHFRVLGSNVIGLEDMAGGFDQDFDDNIVSFNFKLK